MHIHFSGIGGTGIGPLALIALRAGFTVSGTDKQSSVYINYLKTKGLKNISIPDNRDTIAAIHASQPINWIVYSSALPKERSHHPVLAFAETHGIKSTKRDEFLTYFLSEKNLKLIAIAGTHGKTTTTAMMIWLLKKLSIPVSYSVGAKLSFGEMGEYNKNAKYFVYEADEYDQNFLSFHPDIALVSGIAYDHPDTYPTKEAYNEAFLRFIKQCTKTYVWNTDAQSMSSDTPNDVEIMQKQAFEKVANRLLGSVNRENAALVCKAVHENIDTSKSIKELGEIMNDFPGVSRRFERITENVYSDYAHTPDKIMGAIDIARESLKENQNLVVVYEGLHNNRQHFIKKELKTLFKGVHRLIVVPSYRAREDKSLDDLTPEKLIEIIKAPKDRQAGKCDDKLKYTIKESAKTNLILCLSAGGGGSLDEWLRREFA